MLLAGLHSEMLCSQHDILGQLFFFAMRAGFSSRCVTCTIGSLDGQHEDSHAVWLVWLRCHQTNGRLLNVISRLKERKGKDRKESMLQKTKQQSLNASLLKES